MEQEKETKIRIEIDITHRGVECNSCKNIIIGDMSAEAGNLACSKESIIAMWLAVRSLKKEIEENGESIGMDFDKFENILTRNKSSKKRGLLDGLVDWVTGK